MPETPVLQIDRLVEETLHIPIVGVSPLISNRFSEKAKRIMLDTMQGRRRLKEPKDPQAEYEASLYRLNDGYGFPATAFFKATVGAARFYGKSVRMTELRQFLEFSGEYSEMDGRELTRIEGEPKMREDYVRNSGASRGADLRYRAEFREWNAVLIVTYVKSCISRESVISLIDAGGGHVGVGDWRQEKEGEFGRYTIDENRDVDIEKP